jgi:hypothetical protein
MGHDLTSRPRALKRRLPALLAPDRFTFLDDLQRIAPTCLLCGKTVGASGSLELWIGPSAIDTSAPGPNDACGI